MPDVARNERLIDNGRPPPRTERTAARELCVHGGKPRLGESGDREISGRPSGVRGDSDSVAGPGTARRLGFGSGDPRGRRSTRHALHPRTGDRDLLHDVPAAAGRQEGARPGLRHHAMPAARRRRYHRGVPEPHPSRSLPSVQGRKFQLGRGRVSWRLRERANGTDLEGYLRRSEQGKLWQGAGRFCLRQPGETGTAERPSVLGADGWTDHAEGNHMKRDRAGDVTGSAEAMRHWRYIALHAVTAAAFIFLLQRYALSASLDSSLLWALTFGGCAAGLAYMQSNR